MILIYMIMCFMVTVVLCFGHYGFLQEHLGVFAINLVFDYYSFTFLLLLFLISSCVLAWSYYYMDLEVSYRRFLCLVFAFLCSMCLLIVVSTLFAALIGWDCLGVTSFLLVIYYKNRKSLGSGMITALSNRMGDCFLLGLLALMFCNTSNSHVLTYLLLLTGMTKSAQFPFSSWLPAAMAAPTPVSALVHSSTLVTAGVYLLLRFNGLGTEWLLVVGSVTMSMAGLCACAEMDLKKIVALSTLSQLGVMMVALSLSMKGLCFFHLTTHAMFKALLFMCVGVGIHSVYGGQDFRSFSGFGGTSLFPSLGLTVSNMSLSGFPFMAGFYSKDAILEAFYNEARSYLFLLVFLLGVGLTAAYSLKVALLAFVSHDSAGSADLNGGGMSWVVKLPLTILSVFSVSGGAVLCSEYGPFAPLVVYADKLLPLVMCSVGLLLGFACSRLKHPFLSSMWHLTPFFQKMSSVSVEMSSGCDMDRGVLSMASNGMLLLSIPILFDSVRWMLLSGVFVWLVCMA
uniref:NADH:ubiquinone reductase (H(+)-translocating) n=1 Tax=Parasagitta elegans TaxID=1562708 RepID=A0A141CLK5_9BILA|nr:NADH dehydrogenase subunit 5 [Parasagitta elegans]